MTFFCASQLSICLAERDGTLDVSGRIQNTDFAGAKARAGFCIVDCLTLLWKHRLDARGPQKLSSP